jgi:hypothetical protein
MSSKGEIIIINIENIEDVINKLFIEAYIKKNNLEIYNKIYNQEFTYKQINKEKKEQLKYSVSYNNHESNNKEIIIDLTDYKKLIKNLKYIVLLNCSKIIPYEIIETKYIDCSTITPLSKDNTIYYFDNIKNKIDDKETIINYFRFEDIKILKNFINKYFKYEIKNNNEYLKLFNYLFNNIIDFTTFFDLIFSKNELIIYEVEIWS